MKPIEAEVDDKGQIHMKEPIALPPGARVLITIVPDSTPSETALLSESSLATEWDRPEEDAAWADLAPE
jgi:hypothetical protein